MTWDLSSYFPQFNGPEMIRFKEDLKADIAALTQQAARAASLSDATAGDWEQVILRSEDVSRRMSHLSSYVGCLAASDARNEEYSKEEAALVRLRADFAKVRIEMLRGFKGASDEAFGTFISRPELNGAKNFVERLREEA